MVSRLGGEGKWRVRAEGFGFVSEGSTCLPPPFLCLSSPPHLQLPVPRTPSLSLQGAILTTMLATRNFSGRWWDSKSQLHPAQVCWENCWLPVGPQARGLGRVRATKDPKTGT